MRDSDSSAPRTTSSTATGPGRGTPAGRNEATDTEDGWSGFHRLPLGDRRARMARAAGLTVDDLRVLGGDGGLDLEHAEHRIESVFAERDPHRAATHNVEATLCADHPLVGSLVGGTGQLLLRPLAPLLAERPSSSCRDVAASIAEASP